jgi:hypothetical protein
MSKDESTHISDVLKLSTMGDVRVKSRGEKQEDRGVLGSAPEDGRTRPRSLRGVRHAYGNEDLISITQDKECCGAALGNFRNCIA